MGFDRIEGQSRAGRQIAELVSSGRLPHALLFLGSAGTGRRAMARELAAALLCSQPTDAGEACGACADCRMLAAGTHPDCMEVGLPDARQSLPLQVVRDVQHTAGLKPVRAARRAFIVNDAERMTEEAANAFLKTLEEPPGGCVFVLIASSLRRIPETIVSRCRLVRFANLERELLARRLEAQGYGPADAHWLAGRCWGAPGLAERLGSAGLHERNREMLARLQAATAEDNLDLSDWLGEQAKLADKNRPRDALQDLLECAAVYYRDLALLAAAPEAECPVVNLAAEAEMRERAAQGDAEEFLEHAETVMETIEMVGGNAQMRLALDRMFARLCAAGLRT